MYHICLIDMHNLYNGPDNKKSTIENKQEINICEYLNRSNDTYQSHLKLDMHSPLQFRVLIKSCCSDLFSPCGNLAFKDPSSSETVLGLVVPWNSSRWNLLQSKITL